MLLLVDARAELHMPAPSIMPLRNHGCGTNPFETPEHGTFDNGSLAVLRAGETSDFVLVAPPSKTLIEERTVTKPANQDKSLSNSCQLRISLLRNSYTSRTAV